MSYFQLPPGVSLPALTAPLWNVGLVVFGFCLAKWVFHSVRAILRNL